MTNLTAKPRVLNLENGIKLIKDGNTIALGGFMVHNHPMALVREIIRQNKKNLSLIISPSAGPAADLLIGAGCVSEVRATYIGFDHLGLAPCFRRAAQDGKIKILEYDEATIVAGLRAAAGKLPFCPVTSVIGSDILKVNPELKVMENPLDKKKEMVVVPPLKPDIMIGHVQSADYLGNAQHWGSRFTDIIMARAAEKVLITTDELISSDEWIKTPALTTLPAAHVDVVIHQYGGAYPCSSHGRYIHDEEQLKLYLELAKKNELDHYLEEYIYSFDENSTKKRVKQFAVSVEVGTPAAGITEKELTADTYSISEFLSIILSRELRDGEIGGVGANSAIPIGAVRLAQQSYAPNLSFVLSGGGVFNSKSKRIYRSSTDCRYFLDGAEAIMELGNDFFDFVEQGPDFFFFSGIQIDKHGNFNLHCVGDWEKPKFRGPGLPSVAAAVNAGRFYLYSINQTRRQFVEKCDFISGPGFLDGRNNREKLGIEGGGPVLCVTNLAVYDFDPESKSMRLKSLHPGITLETVEQNTGFELVVPGKIPVTPSPTKRELGLLRTMVDTTRTLA